MKAEGSARTGLADLSSAMFKQLPEAHEKKQTQALTPSGIWVYKSIFYMTLFQKQRSLGD